MAEKTIELVDARLTEAARILVELAKQSKQTQHELAILAKRSDERFEQFKQELSEQTKKTQTELDSLAKQVKETNKQMGELSNRLGTLVEDIVSPDMLRVLRQVAHIPEEIEGIINVRQREFYNGKDLNGHPSVMEFDAIARCGDYALVNETKTTLRPEQVKEFLAKLAMARDYFPQLVGKQIIGAISSLRIEPSLIKHASNQGLLVLALGEGMLQLKNEADFQPKIF